LSSQQPVKKTWALMLSPNETVQYADNAGRYKVNKTFSSCLISSIIAGLFISIAFAFYVTVTTGTSTIPWGIAKLIGGICFSLGLILVVICAVDLFTSTVLTIIPKMTGKITWAEMFKNWGLVYFGNLIGALIFVAIIWFGSEHMAAKGQWGLNILNIASHKLHHTFVEAVFLGIVANLMVCYAVWMGYSSKTVSDKILTMILPIAMFVAGGFEHSIANMFMIPMGIVIQSFATPEFWQMIGMNAADFAHVNIQNFITLNLIPVTIGNIIGGLMVALPFWWMNMHKPIQKS
jgi:formate transporter